MAKPTLTTEQKDALANRVRELLYEIAAKIHDRAQNFSVDNDSTKGGSHLDHLEDMAYRRAVAQSTATARKDKPRSSMAARTYAELGW